LSVFGLERERRVFAIVLGEARIISASKSIRMEIVRSMTLRYPMLRGRFRS